jgi:hypothetical protein
MIGYVARDQNETLGFHYIKPSRKGTPGNIFWVSDERTFVISDEDFPEFKTLTWKDTPVRVGFDIHKANIQK